MIQLLLQMQLVSIIGNVFVYLVIYQVLALLSSLAGSDAGHIAVFAAGNDNVDLDTSGMHVYKFYISEEHSPFEVILRALP